jgi:plasmid stabilization system protein ParE
MATVVVAAAARRDLREIRRFIERDSPRAAQRTAASIIAAARRLQDFPESGRVVPELRRADVREVIYRRYRIIYHLASARVRVVMVLHSARLLERTELRSRLP